MLLIRRVSDIQKHLLYLRKQRKRIGFVPSMGALHAGHLSLAAQSIAQNDITVVSIFVNPSQFNNTADLEKYPRTPERDINLLSTTLVNIVFMPTVEDIYPPGGDDQAREFDFGKLDKVLEGEFRPGHFAGMARVVHRLLNIISPDSLYMGLKDFQQFTIVKKMLGILKSSTLLIPCETLREPDGLAMSSRNMRLSETERTTASKIYQVLRNVQTRIISMSPPDLQHYAVTQLQSESLFRVEYFEIVDGRTLMPLTHFNDTDFAVALTAVFVGEVRLIDNVILKRPKGF